MPYRNNQFWTDFFQWLNTYSAVIFAFFLAVFISVFSTAKKHGKIDWLEALICGGLTVAIASVLSYINLPNQLAVFIGGFIGFKGSLWVEEKFNQEYQRRYQPPCNQQHKSKEEKQETSNELTEQNDE